MPQKGTFSQTFSFDLDSHILKRSEKIMKKARGRIVVAISGGKDSLTCSHILKRLNIEHELIHLNLGIPEFSSESLRIIKDHAEKNSVKLSIINIQDYAKQPIPDFIPLVQKLYHKDKPCALCGLFKRYVINKWAWENQFDYIVTGHNLDDTAATIIMNIMSQDVDQLIRVDSVIEKVPETKMVGRVKPLYWVREELILKYANNHNIETVKIKCPYSAEVHQNKIKKAVQEFEYVEKDFTTNLTKTIKKIKKRIELEKIEVSPCAKCGFATTAGTCKFCRVLERI
ncbi:adenine nucleotide alpha hydrolase family protein [Candidatus Micrarchaeota archaeon]|nr:adenine nucleotide alpha hydrolase family protein [Candidatus Micrarchaeota archaeon]